MKSEKLQEQWHYLEEVSGLCFNEKQGFIVQQTKQFTYGERAFRAALMKFEVN